jgi:endonuclease YncB( thermonuclease family)
MIRGQRLGLFAVGLAFAAGIAVGVVLGPMRASRAVPAGPIAPSGPAATLELGTYPAEVLRTVDGDTFEARVRLWPGLDTTTKIRLLGIDAPELSRARCPAERSKAEAAKNALAAILVEGEVTVRHVRLDKYGGRVLADAATRATPNVSAAMLARGLARPYDGGRRESWCDGGS